MKAKIDGKAILSEDSFHQAVAATLSFPAYYGRNLDALRDCMTADVERPVVLVWEDSEVSRRAFPERFEAIVRVLREIEREDRALGLPDGFELNLD